MPATEPIRNKKQFRELVNYFFLQGQYRNYALIILGTFTALRISDLLRLKWDDVYNSQQKTFYSHLTVQEQKTKKSKTIALNKEILKALKILLPHRRGSYIFASNRGDKPISRVQAWRIIRDAVREISIQGNISCHSLRKTWGYHAWTSGKVSPVVIMDILNHSDYEVTRRYLGITQDDLDRAYLDPGIL